MNAISNEMKFWMAYAAGVPVEITGRRFDHATGKEIVTYTTKWPVDVVVHDGRMIVACRPER